MKKSVFRLYANCIPVKGVRRSSICDLHRNDIYYIPNDLYHILTEYRDLTLDEIKERFKKGNISVVEEYFDFLLTNDIGFWTSEAERFPDMSTEWDEPSIITNAIIDVNCTSTHDYQSIIDQFEQVGCKHLQLRFYDVISQDELERILLLFERRRVVAIDIFLRHHLYLKPKYLENLSDQNLRINLIIVHSAPEYRVHRLNGELMNNRGNIIYTKQVIDSNAHCGNISSRYFSYNIKTFTEALRFNSCLNRKIGIDTDGSIKNCPSLVKVYGNIKYDNILKYIESEDFQSLWHVNKGKVNICNVCEHRYICTDCRAFGGEDPEDSLFPKPAKCRYNPFTATWEKEVSF